MTHTFYLSAVLNDKDIVLVDNKGNRYNIPEFAKTDENSTNAIEYVVEHTRDRALRVMFDDVAKKWNTGTSKLTNYQDAPSYSSSIILQQLTKTQDNTVSEPVIQVVEKAEPVVSEFQKFIHKTSITLKPEQLKVSELKWKYMVRNIMQGKNIMTVGAAGTGKTYFAQCAAKAFPDRHFAYFNLGNTDDARAALLGNTHFSKDSGTYFSPSAFVKAIQTENAIILLDELSRAHPSAWNILMSVLDQGQRYLRLDESDGSPVINVAKGVCFIATANIGAEYTATRVLDRALLDRFSIIEIDVLNKKQEIELLTMMYPGLHSKKINAIAEIAEITRNEIKSETPKIGTIISTRVTVELASLLSDGFKLDEAAQVAIYPFYDSSGGVDSERTFIRQCVEKYLSVDNTDNDLFKTKTNKKEEVVDNSNIQNRKPF